MWGSKKQRRTPKIDSVIGRNTEVLGDLRFSGGLHVDGTIRGNVYAEDEDAALTLSPQGTVEGDVSVHNVILDGVVIGDVHAGEHIQLNANARITGNVYYRLIEMAMGAEVNGSLLHQGIEEREPKLQIEHDAELDLGTE